MADEVERKQFAHLLEPIRDLGTNWNIDIAFLLEEYLHELESVTISLDEGKTHINFAEAALVIQGSTAVYSKKVEYLFALTNQALDIIRSRKDAATKEVKNGDNKAAADDNDIPDDDEPQLLPLDDKTLAEAHNIDLNEEPVDYVTDRAKTMIARAPISVLTITDSDSAESRHYKISNCIVHSSGALLLEERDTLLLDSVTLRRKSMVESTPFGSPLDAPTRQDRRKSMRASLMDADGKFGVVLESLEEEDKKRGPLDAEFEAVARPLDEVFDRKSVDATLNNNNGDPLNEADSDDSDNEKETNANSNEQQGETKQQQAAAAARASLLDQSSLNGYGDDEEDPWATVSPHDAGTIKPRPFVRGRTYRIPKLLQSADLPSSSVMKQFVDVLHSTPLQAAYARNSTSNQLKLPYWREFSSIYLDSLAKQQALRRVANQIERASNVRNERAARMMRRESVKKALQAVAAGEPDQGERSDDDKNGRDPFDSSDDDNDRDQWDDRQEGKDGKDVADANKSAATDNLPDFSQSKNSSDEPVAQTIEDLCKDHVAMYLSSAADYFQETQLSKRVAEWQDRLVPALEEEERRQAFDIHSYGRHIISRIADGDEKDLVEPQVMNFETAIKGQERYQVCRFFLATLQLANGGNVEITPSQLAVAEDKSVAEPVVAAVATVGENKGKHKGAATRAPVDHAVADATNSSMQLRLLRKEIREVDIDNEGYRLTADDIKESKDNAAAAAVAASSSSSSAPAKKKGGRKPKSEAKAKSTAKGKAAAKAKAGGKKRSRATAAANAQQFDEHGEALPSAANGGDDE